MRAIWLLTVLFASGCAAWLQRGPEGYPDAHLARFAPAAVGMRWDAAVSDHEGRLLGLLDMEVVDLGTREPGRRSATIHATGSALGQRFELTEREELYPDRIEIQAEDAPAPRVDLRTPLRPGTRWRYTPSGTTFEHSRAIAGIEDVCNRRGFFKGALVVQEEWIERAQDGRTELHEKTEWYAPDIGTVQELERVDHQPVKDTRVTLFAFWPAKGTKPLAFVPCP